MNRKNVVIKKLLCALFARILCATPIAIAINTEADPRHSQNQGRNNSEHQNRNRYQTYTGTVTDVVDDSFEFRVGKKEYEVHPSGTKPRQLRKGD